MSLLAELLFGAALLALCFFLHIAIVIGGLRLWRHARPPVRKRSLLAVSGHLALAFLAILVGHSIQVWIWAVAFMQIGALSTLNDAIYFSLVTYTTLGFGDIVFEEGARIFAAMEAVTGWLGLGLSTAFLVGLITRLLQDEFAP